MDSRVKRIYNTMLTRFYTYGNSAFIAKQELETLVDLKNAEIRWINK